MSETVATKPRTLHGPYKNLVKAYELGEFKAGDKVRLDTRFLCERVQWAGDWTWEILAFTTNIDNGRQWVELFGGHEKWAHTFACSIHALISPRRKK